MRKRDKHNIDASIYGKTKKNKSKTNNTKFIVVHSIGVIELRPLSEPVKYSTIIKGELQLKLENKLPIGENKYKEKKVAAQIKECNSQTSTKSLAHRYQARGLFSLLHARSLPF